MILSLSWRCACTSPSNVSSRIFMGDTGIAIVNPRNCRDLYSDLIDFVNLPRSYAYLGLEKSRILNLTVLKTEIELVKKTPSFSDFVGLERHQGSIWQLMIL